MPLDFSACRIPEPCQRLIFAVTQPDACRQSGPCGTDCGEAGLRLIEADDGSGVYLDKSNFVRGLFVNILLTDARREDTNCGWTPGLVGGHWSESFISPSESGGIGVRIGSSLRYLRMNCSNEEAVSQVTSVLQEAGDKLRTYGVALDVEVEARYAGGGRVEASVVIIGPAGETTKVGTSAIKLSNGWVWEAEAANG